MALLNNANSVVLAHNHPGGSLRLSLADENATQKISTALNTVNISIADHIIIAADSYYSFAENGQSLREESMLYKTSNNALDDRDGLVSNLRGVHEITSNEVKTSSINYTAKTIEDLNEIFETNLTTEELHNLYKSVGKMYESSGDIKDLKLFQTMEKVVGELKQVQSAEKKEQNNEKEVRPQTAKEFDMEV